MGALSRTQYRNQLRLVEEMRACLPASQYIVVLHEAATMGRMPKLDKEGNPTGTFIEIDPKDRIGIAKYLLDKVMPGAPDPKAPAQAIDEAQAADVINANVNDPRKIHQLPTEDLERIRDAEFEKQQATDAESD